MYKILYLIPCFVYLATMIPPDIVDYIYELPTPNNLNL